MGQKPSRHRSCNKMSFTDAYQSLIDFDLNNERKKKKERKENMKKDTKNHEETRKPSRSRSPKVKETRKRSRSRSPKVKVESKEEETIDYDIPNRQYGDLYCPKCDAHMNSEQMWINHINGKRHLKSTTKGEEAEPKFEYCSDEPTIKKDLDKETRPIAGLDHICEILKINQPPSYQCFLCSASFTNAKFLIQHLTGLKHQMAFLKEHVKEKYSLVDSSSLSKSYLEPIVQDLILKYEQEHGRGKMSVKKERAKSGSFSSKKSYADNGDPPKSSRHSPPPKSCRYSSPPKPSRYSSPPRSSRYSPPSKSSRYPSPPRSSRYSPPSKSSRYPSPPPKSSRYSSSRSTRMKERNSESLWQKVSPVREKSSEISYPDRYSEDEKWEKIEPESTYYRRVPANQDADPRLEQTDNYRHAWPSADAGKNCNDLRVVLEQKKSLGITSSVTRANMPESASVSSKITDVSDDLLHLVDDMSPEVFLSLALFKLNNMHMKSEIEIKLLDRVANKATELALVIKKKLSSPDLKTKYKKALAQNGISSQGGDMVAASSKNNMQFTQNLDGLIGHYKARKATAFEDVHSKDPYSNALMGPERYIDASSSSNHRLKASAQYKTSPERSSSFDSEWNQRSSTSALPFQSFSSTPTIIPGLTLTEELPAQPSTSTVMSQFAQTANNIFGNINVPSTQTYSYQNENYDRLNYHY